MKKLYLDNAATTQVSEKVVKEMERFYLEDYGNPGSIHRLGEKAFDEMSKARAKLAKEIGAKPREIYFTSGGTESDNWALIGTAEANPNNRTIIVSSIEHPAIIEAGENLSEKSFKIIKIKVNSDGIINIDELEREIKNKDVLLVSVMHVNNIIGTIQDLEAIGKLCRRHGVLFHTDAVQGFGKLDIDVKEMNIDLLSATAHKIGGPKGIGLLYVRDGVKIRQRIYGGGQEKGMRSGTENVPGIVGFAKALELQKKVNKKKVQRIRDKIIIGLEKIGGKINGSKEKRIWNNIHFSFLGINGENLVVYLSERGIYVSTGSACDSKKKKEDRVLRAIGLPRELQEGSIRITLGEDIDEKDADRVVGEIKKGLKLFFL